MIKRFIEFCNPISYEDNVPIRLAAKGIIYDYSFYIVDYGIFPCAYVRIPDGHPYFGNNKIANINISCHGGITYANNKIFNFSPDENKYVKGWFIGWDYAHFPRDYYGKVKNNKGKKWSTEEIIAECENVIHQLIEVAK